MKNSWIFQSMQILIMIGLLAPSATILGQKTLAQKAAEKAKQTYQATKTGAQTTIAITKPTAQKIIARAKQKAQAAIKSAKKKFLASKKQATQLTARELSSIKLGIDATQKKLRGQALSEAEKLAMKTLAQYSAAVLAIIATATMIGASIYLGTRKEETDLPLSLDEQIIERINEQGILQKEKDLIAKLYHEERAVSEAIYQASLQAKIIPPSEKHEPLSIEPRIGDATKGTPVFKEQGPLPSGGGISVRALQEQRQKLRESPGPTREKILTPLKELLKELLKERRKEIQKEDEDDDDDDDDFEFWN